jgi:ketosteroid isomerase-like protein
MTDPIRLQNREVIEQFFTRLESMNIDYWLELWDESGLQEMPYSPEGFPKQLEGKAAIKQQYSSLPENFHSMQFVDRVVHETLDPSIFIVEYRGIIDVKLTGKPYNNLYCGIFTIQNGKLVHFKEYFDPIILQTAFGTQLQENFNVNG